MKKAEPNRIYFLGNPYPKGHKIKEFIWSARIDKNSNIWFDFHLKSDDYYSEDRTEEEDDLSKTNWTAKIAWTNYHRCILSSTFWSEENKGIKVKGNTGKLNFENCIKNEFIVNKLPLPKGLSYDDLAFDIYLLGHDNCAHHRIKITKKENDYSIEWTGKIALTYSGGYTFDYDFIANIANAKFEGFHYPKSWSLKKAKEMFQNNLEDFENYEFVDLNPKSNKREYKLSKINQ